MYYDSELLALVAGLGSLVKNEQDGTEVYVKGPKCLGMYDTPASNTATCYLIFITLVINYTNNYQIRYKKSSVCGENRIKRQETCLQLWAHGTH